MDDDIILKVENVSKLFKLPHEKQSSVKGALINFKKRRNFEMQKALQDISLEVKRGEFFGIVGRNGSGKSTLLKLLAGIYTPTHGKIIVNGTLNPFIELGVGFNPELTGRDNVFLNGALLGFSRKEMLTMYDEIVEFAELERFMDQKLKNFSSGMQVRLAFSIAIRARSDILVLDEVLAVGDIAFQEKSFNIFRDMKRTGRTVIFVSHDLNSVREFCERVAIIDKSRLEGVGKTADMVMKYEVIMAKDAREQKPGTANANRPGTGSCTILDVEFLNDDGKKVAYIEENEPFSVKVKFRANQDIEALVGVAIDDDTGTNLLGPNTGEDKNKISLKKGEQKQVVATFNQNALSAGNYSITAGIFNEDSTVPFDFFKDAKKFKILGKKRHGKVNTRPKWTIS